MAAGTKIPRRVASELTVSYCPQCSSTERTKYCTVPDVEHVKGNRTVLTVAGKIKLPFNRIVTRKTNCKNCGTARFDRSYELV